MKLSIMHCDLVCEDIKSKMPLLLRTLISPKSKWRADESFSENEAAEFVLSLEQWDPTGNAGTYLPYMVRQLAIGNLIISPGNDEDGPRIRSALEYFHKNKNKPEWDLPKDINRINWKELEDKIGEGDLQSKRERKKVLSGSGMSLVFEEQLNNSEESLYKIYRFIEPEATAIWAYGTKWCVTMLISEQREMIYGSWHPKAGQKRNLVKVELSAERLGYPYQAQSYLNTGPLFMIFRYNKSNNTRVGGSNQLMLLHEPSNQMKNVHDVQISRCAPATDYVIAHWMAADQGAPTKLLKAVRRLCPDYNGRPA